jgi:Fe-Mn family superoxide dismutase
MNRTIFLFFLGASIAFFNPLIPGISWNSSYISEKVKFTNFQDTDEYQAKDYSYLLGMRGFTDQLLKMHFSLYQGYVKNTNLLLKKLAELSSQEQYDYAFGALKRRLGWEFDGMRLHEFYFENLGGKEGIASSSAFYRRLQRDFGTYEKWKKDFIATGMIRGIGWAVLYRDPKSGRLINTWINEHDLGHLAGSDPILIMDVFEHAYMPQYGLDRKQYIEAFFDNINWSIVYQRYNESLRK